jgi:hypothetical protein
MQRWAGQYSERLLEIVDCCLHLDHLSPAQSVSRCRRRCVETVIPPKPNRHPGNWLGRSSRN